MFESEAGGRKRVKSPVVGFWDLIGGMFQSQCICEHINFLLASMCRDSVSKTMKEMKRRSKAQLTPNQ